MLIAHHRVPAPAFTLLAHGRADARVMGLLRAGRQSKQTLLIRAILDAARPFRRAAAAAGLDDAVALIDEVQQRSPAAAAEVIGYPLVGAWAAQCLRRLRRGGTQLDAGTPLWVELAHLAAVAAAAAIRGGIAVAMPVPMRRGAVTLPTLGQARLASDAEWGMAAVRGRAGGYTIEGHGGTVAVPPDPDQQTTGWQAVRRLAFTERGIALTVWLDDVDPYRRGHGVATERLDDRALESWRSQLAQAWAMLVEDHPERVAELASGPITVVPLAETTRAPHVSATTRDAVGAMALTLPPDSLTMSQSLVHEVQHSKLGALLDLVELYDTDERRRFYSPWRPDPRPIGGLLQGGYAFLAVATFWLRYADRDRDAVAQRVAEYELARTSAQVRIAVRDLADSGALTEPGTRFVAGLREAVDALASRPVADDTARLARLVRDDHRLSWRLRNLRVEPETLAALAEAWHDSAARPPGHPPPRLAAGGPPTYVGQPRHALAMQALGEPHAIGTGPDAALVTGDYEAAARGFLVGLDAEPERLDHWTGLALARMQSGPPDLARIYATEPETLVALYERLLRDGAAVTPDPLAGWLAG
jgi:HEXXH motif-containing protein